MKLRGFLLVAKGIGFPFKGLRIFRQYVFGSDKPLQPAPILEGRILKVSERVSSTMMGDTQLITITANVNSFAGIEVTEASVFVLEAQDNVEWSSSL